MEGVAPAVSLFRPRASARLPVLLAADSGAARMSPGAGGNSNSREFVGCLVQLRALVLLDHWGVFLSGFLKGRSRVSRRSPEMSPPGAGKGGGRLAACFWLVTNFDRPACLFQSA